MTGRAIAKQMKTPDPIDVNIFGAVRLAASAEDFIQQVRQIDVYERRIGINAVGKFHTPPLLADLDGLMLDRDELAEIRACRPADCDAQLPPHAMERDSARRSTGRRRTPARSPARSSAKSCSTCSTPIAPAATRAAWPMTTARSRRRSRPSSVC